MRTEEEEATEGAGKGRVYKSADGEIDALVPFSVHVVLRRDEPSLPLRHRCQFFDTTMRAFDLKWKWRNLLRLLRLRRDFLDRARRVSLLLQPEMVDPLPTGPNVGLSLFGLHFRKPLWAGPLWSPAEFRQPADPLDHDSVIFVLSRLMLFRNPIIPN